MAAEYKMYWHYSFTTGVPNESSETLSCYWRSRFCVYDVSSSLQSLCYLSSQWAGASAGSKRYRFDELICLLRNQLGSFSVRSGTDFSKHMLLPGGTCLIRVSESVGQRRAHRRQNWRRFLWLNDLPLWLMQTSGRETMSEHPEGRELTKSAGFLTLISQFVNKNTQTISFRKILPRACQHEICMWS